MCRSMVKFCFIVLMFTIVLQTSFLSVVLSLESNKLSQNKPIPSEKFNHDIQLDTRGDYWLFWTVDGPNITFEVHVNTKGYVGFGLSQNGNMYPADVIVGWITDDGARHFQDCHTMGKYTPVVDAIQNWHLLRGEENVNGTILTFTRQLDTCDNNDVIITSSTIKVIFSYHDDDPDRLDEMSWHGVQHRGSKSLRLLTSEKTDVILPTDAISFDIIAKDFSVPEKNTRYQCFIHKIPELYSKLHIIRYEPIIKPESGVVHHMNILRCPTYNKDDVGKSYDCFNNEPSHLSECKDIIAAWAIGSGPHSMPEHVGFPLNEIGKPTIYKLQIHYHNPGLKQGLIDNSGIRLIATPTLRLHEAGGLFVGVGIHDLNVIPPYEARFTSMGMCSSECTSKALSGKGIKIYGVYQHTHLMGREIVTRHIRGHTELPPIAVDHNYDYAYQEIQVLDDEIEVKPGDTIITECKYDSTKQRNVTLGGIGVNEEMCITLLYYYPKVTMTECVSNPLYNNIAKHRKEVIKQMFTLDWQDKSVRDRFQQLTENSTHVVYCNVHSPRKYNNFRQTVPRPTEVNKKRNRNCQDYM